MCKSTVHVTNFTPQDTQAIVIGTEHVVVCLISHSSELKACNMQGYKAWKKATI